MKIQIIESIAATKHLLKFYKHTFELVGYDFMLIDGINQTDNPYEVRLIEVNTNPCIEEPN